MNCVSYDTPGMRVPLLVLFVLFFPWGIPPLQSDWSLSYDHGLHYASYCDNNNNNNNKPP